MTAIHLKPKNWEESNWTCPIKSGSWKFSLVRAFRSRGDSRQKLSPRQNLRNLHWVCLLAASASVWIGCAQTRNLVIREPVGPLHSAAESGSSTGSLVVYSAWDRFDTLDAEHPKHTSYTVRPEEGSTLVRVSNKTGSFEGDPQVVNLKPGRYWIQSRATNVGPIQVAAVIRAGATTVVYLDGTTEPSASGSQATNWIRQPNGRILGWKDNNPQPTLDRVSVAQP